MAALQHSPRPDSIAELEQPVTYKEASALFSRTGHDVRSEVLRRWVKEDNIPTVSVRGRTGPVKYVDWSDLLAAHFKRTAAKLRASSDWP